MIIPTQWFPVPQGAAMCLVLIEKFDDGDMLQVPWFIHINKLAGKDQFQLEKLATEEMISAKLVLARLKGEILEKKEQQRKEKEQCESSSAVPTEPETEKRTSESPDDSPEKQ